jgi:hypothetical protein
VNKQVSGGGGEGGVSRDESEATRATLDALPIHCNGLSMEGLSMEGSTEGLSTDGLSTDGLSTEGLATVRGWACLILLSPELVLLLLLCLRFPPLPRLL